MRVFQPFAQHLAARSSAPRTIATYLAILEAFARHAASDLSVPPSPSQVEAFLARPTRDGRARAPTAHNQALAALRAFARYASRDLGWTSDPTSALTFVRVPRRSPAVLSIGELRTLFTTAATTARAHERARDLAILALLSQTGLRVHELVGLDVDQVDLGSATLIAVHGKGGTQHDVVLNAPALALVSVWIDVRRERVSVGERALFLSAQRKRLSVRSVEHLFQRLRGAMGTSKTVTPHTMRHTCATLSIALGTDLVTVAGLLRHADLNTTRLYIHLVDTQRREAVGRLAVTVPPDLVPMAPAYTPTPVLAPMPKPMVPRRREAPVSPRSIAPCAEENFDDIGEVA